MNQYISFIITKNLFVIKYNFKKKSKHIYKPGTVIKAGCLTVFFFHILTYNMTLMFIIFTFILSYTYNDVCKKNRQTK